MSLVLAPRAQRGLVGFVPATRPKLESQVGEPHDGVGLPHLWTSGLSPCMLDEERILL
jgi:hypothetical protein